MTTAVLSNLLDLIMIVAFGLSWPFAIVKSYKSRTAKGKSVQFELLIEVGYIAGIVRKAVIYFDNPSGNNWLFYLAWAFYVINFIQIIIDLCLYARNKKIDQERDAILA